MSSGLFKMFTTNYLFTHHIYLVYMYKQDLALNHLQCYKNQPTNQVIYLRKKDSIPYWICQQELTCCKTYEPATHILPSIKICSAKKSNKQ